MPITWTYCKNNAMACRTTDSGFVVLSPSAKRSMRQTLRFILNHRRRKLNKTEIGFITQIEKDLPGLAVMSAKQMAWVQRIFDRAS